MSAMRRLFPGAEHLDELEALVRMAVELSQSDLGDPDAIRMLGEGWVAEETLAIAVYCALKNTVDEMWANAENGFCGIEEIKEECL